MKNEFIPYEQALELKELGFDELCMAGYDKDFIGKLYIGFSTDDGALFNTEYYILAPLYQQAFRWLNEKLNTKGLMPISDDEYRLQMLKNLIKKLSSKKKKNRNHARHNNV